MSDRLGKTRKFTSALLTLQKLQHQATNGLGLFLLDPVPGPFQQVDAPQIRADPVAHPFQAPGPLVDTPVARTTDEE